MPTKPRYRLSLKSLRFISAVDRPAQETASVRLVKREGDELELDGLLQARVAKIDDELGLVFLWAVTEKVAGLDYWDLQGDNVAADDNLIKAAAEFMKAGGASDEMHDQDQTGRVVFAFPWTAEVAKSMLGDDFEATTTGLMIGLEPSPEAFRKFKSGEYGGVSIDGRGSRDAVKGAEANAGVEDAHKAAPTKTEGGMSFTAADYAYVPDAQKPSTWKLRLAAKPGAGPDAGIVGAAVAALGKGFRGNKVQIPAAAMGKVKAKVRSAWMKANPKKTKADLPAVIKGVDELMEALVDAPDDAALYKAATDLALAVEANSDVASKRRSMVAVTNGHQHLYDPDSQSGCTTGASMPGDANSDVEDTWHTHPYVIEGGQVTIGMAAGHTHTVTSPATKIDDTPPPATDATSPATKIDTRSNDMGKTNETPNTPAPADDPVVYKSADGVEYRASADPVMVAAIKRADQAVAESDKLRKSLEDERLAKRATDELGNYPGTDAVKAELLRAVDGITDEETRKGVAELLAAGDKAMSKAAQTDGSDAATNATAKGAIEAFEAKVAEIAKRDDCQRDEAFRKTARENPDLYEAYAQA